LAEIWHWKKFEELSLHELHQILRARQKVFIIEQDCLYEDADDFDEGAMHLFNWQKDAKGDPVLAAYLRVLSAGVKYPEITFGRVLVAMEFRGLGLAKEIVATTIKYIEAEYSTQNIRISAQEYLKDFYHDFGFQVCKGPYDEDGIAHLEMLR
jgi:ElaA protein